MFKRSSVLLIIAALVALPLPGLAHSDLRPIDVDGTEPIEPAAYAAVQERLAGNDRYGTAIAVTKKHFTDNSVDRVYIASGENFPDAIAVNSLIAQTEAKDPTAAVLLSPTAGLTPEVLGEVSRLLKPNGAVALIGGPEALAPEVTNQIAKLVPNAKVERIAGPTRVETALEVGNVVHALGPIEEVILTPSEDYQISIVSAALTAKRMAVQLNAPATADGTLHPAVKAWIETAKPKKITVVGQASFLSAWTQPNVTRISDAQPATEYTPECKPNEDCPPKPLPAPAGPDQVIAEHLMVNEFADAKHLVLVSRDRAVDGIAAGQFAAQQYAPILPVALDHEAAKRYAHILHEKGKRRQITLWAIGGEQAISEAAQKTIAETFSN